MGGYYDEVEIEDMVWDEVKGVYHYPCPCGDRFEITRKQLANYEDIATCPSCSLIIRVIYDPLDFEDEPSDDDKEGKSGEDEDTSEDNSEDEDTNGEKFVDALDDMAISEKPAGAVISVGA